VKFNSAGSAVYGTTTVAIDGAVPAALAGRVTRLPGWRSSSIVLYLDGNTGTGPWQLYTLTLPATTALEDATSATLVGAGGGVWAAFLGGSGLRTSVGGLGPFSSSTLGDVSPDGQIVRIDDATTLTGLTVYDATGATLWSDASVTLTSPELRLRDNYLAYRSAAGWQLIDVTTATVPRWYPRTDTVTLTVPCVAGGVLYVIEAGDAPTGLTFRQADRAQGYVLRAAPGYAPDAVVLSATQVYAGLCTSSDEAASSLEVYDVTVGSAAALTTAMGTVSGGAVVFGAAGTTAAQIFTVGALQGATLSPTLHMPVRQPMIDPTTGLITREWQQYLEGGAVQTTRLSAVVQATPVASQVGQGFDELAVTGQPTLAATLGARRLTFASADGTVSFGLNPATNTVDFDVDVTADGYWVPLSNGDPINPEILFNGLGEPIMVWVPA